MPVPNAHPAGDTESSARIPNDVRIPYCITMAIKTKKKCPNCGAEIEGYLNPLPTVDIIIELHGKGILLIKRKNFPIGWA